MRLIVHQNGQRRQDITINQRQERSRLIWLLEAVPNITQSATGYTFTTANMEAYWHFEQSDDPIVARQIETAIQRYLKLPYRDRQTFDETMLSRLVSTPKPPQRQQQSTAA